MPNCMSHDHLIIEIRVGLWWVSTLLYLKHIQLPCGAPVLSISRSTELAVPAWCTGISFSLGIGMTMKTPAAVFAFVCVRAYTCVCACGACM